MCRLTFCPGRIFLHCCPSGEFQEEAVAAVHLWLVPIYRAQPSVNSLSADQSELLTATGAALERKGDPAAVETKGIWVPFSCSLLQPSGSTS